MNSRFTRKYYGLIYSKTKILNISGGVKKWTLTSENLTQHAPFLSLVIDAKLQRGIQNQVYYKLKYFKNIGTARQWNYDCFHSVMSYRKKLVSVHISEIRIETTHENRSLIRLSQNLVAVSIFKVFLVKPILIKWLLYLTTNPLRLKRVA